MARHSIESCTLQLSSWRPFLALQRNHSEASTETPITDLNVPLLSALSKRPCLADRGTSFLSIDFTPIDVSKLSLSDEKTFAASRTKETLRMISKRKRRRRGSKSLSGKSCSDWSSTLRCCSVGAPSAGNGNCTDFPLVVGTDSSGELFSNGVINVGSEFNWSSDVSEAKLGKSAIREREEREPFISMNVQFSALDVPQGVESGYGSEPGYRGDVEYGYGDEVDEEEEDARVLFWDADARMEDVGESSFGDQKSHHRGRRRKHYLSLSGMSPDTRKRY